MTILKGNGVSGGIALGNIYIYKISPIESKETFCTPEEVQAQLDRYENVKKQALEELEKIRIDMEKDDPHTSGYY
jgi:phosphoenolpyruvate-protein kinase (PTS system EI component)